MDALESPAAFNEFGSQPVEQFRMSRRHPGLAEIVRRRHETPAEMMLPEAIDDNACGQRVVAAGDPVGEHSATSGRLRAARGEFRCRLLVAGTEDADEP